MKKRKNEKRQQQQQSQNAKRSFTSTIRREEFCYGNSQCAVFEFELSKLCVNIMNFSFSQITIIA